MDLFLDDPNDNVDSSERKFAKRIHLLGFMGCFLPPLNFLLPFIISKLSKSNSSFVKRNVSNVLNLQILYILLVVIAIVLYLFIDLFYILLFGLFLAIFQCFYTYNNFLAAKNGHDYSFPFMIKIFK